MKARHLTAIGLVAGAAIWPAAAMAQGAPPVIGLLHAGSPEENARRLEAALDAVTERARFAGTAPGVPLKRQGGGVSGLIPGGWVRPGAVVIDAGYDHGRGDVDFDGAVVGSVIRRCTFRHGPQSNTDAVDIGPTTSGRAPVRDAMTGTPAAIASRTAFDWPSKSVGRTKRLESFSNAGTSSRRPRKRIFSSDW